MQFCKNCGSGSLTEKYQTFTNGTKHLRVDCNSCGSFQGFKRQNNVKRMKAFTGDSDVFKREYARMHEKISNEFEGKIFTIMVKEVSQWK